MKAKKLNIVEKNIDRRASRVMITKVLDTQINNYKNQFMTAWERDHSASPFEKDEKVKALEAEREAILGFYKALDADESLVDINISINLTIKEPVSIAV